MRRYKGQVELYKWLAFTVLKQGRVYLNRFNLSRVEKAKIPSLSVKIRRDLNMTEE